MTKTEAKRLLAALGPGWVEVGSTDRRLEHAGLGMVVTVEGKTKRTVRACLNGWTTKQCLAGEVVDVARALVEARRA